MKLDDGKPWFRRWLVIGFVPITAEGKLLINVMAGICLFAGFLALLIAESPIGIAVPLAIAFVAVAAGYIVIFWKMEDRF